MKKNDNFENRIYLFLPAIPAIFVGIFADTFFFRWEDCNPYCTGILTLLTIIVIPAIAWVWDIVSEWRIVAEWRFAFAIKKEIKNIFGFMTVGKGLAKRLIITVK